MIDRDQQLARLDDRLERVGELRDGLHLQRGLAVVGAEAGGRVGDLASRTPGARPRSRAAGAASCRGEKCSIVLTWRSPTTMSASPRRIGATSLGMSAPSYWLSASVLTITSAPSFRPASRPAWNAAARPLLLVRRTTWSTPCARATSIVAVGRPVVDDQPLDGVEPGDLAGQVAERHRELRFLVETGNLDDELHAVRRRSAFRMAGCHPHALGRFGRQRVSTTR